MAWQKTPAGVWTPQRTSSVAQNYLRAYRSASDSLRKLGSQFYPEWNATGEVVGDLVGKTPVHGAAILAHLSPSTEAEVNRLMGLQLAARANTTMLDSLVKAGEHLTAAKSAGMTARSREGAEKARLISLAEKHAQANLDLRKKAGIQGTPLNYQASGALAKAANVILGNYDDDVLGSLADASGRFMKIYDFGSSIADPDHPRPPIDTHYHDVGVNRTDIPYDVDRGLEAVSRYRGFQEASGKAHAKFMEETGIELPHSAFMGGAWYAHQQRKAAENLDSLSARRASDTKISRLVNNPQFSDFMPERFGLSPSFGKIDTGL